MFVIEIEGEKDRVKLTHGTGQGQFTEEQYGIKFYGNSGFSRVVPWPRIKGIWESPDGLRKFNV